MNDPVSIILVKTNILCVIPVSDTKSMWKRSQLRWRRTADPCPSWHLSLKTWACLVTSVTWRRSFPRRSLSKRKGWWRQSSPARPLPHIQDVQDQVRKQRYKTNYNFKNQNRVRPHLFTMQKHTTCSPHPLRVFYFLSQYPQKGPLSAFMSSCVW